MLILQPLALVFLIGASAGPEPDPINPCDSITIESTRHALEALRRASSLHGGEKPSRWLFEGTLVVEGHLPRPGMVLTRPVRIELACDGHDRLHLLEVTGEANATSTETTLIVGKRVASQGSSDEPFKELTGTEALATVASVRQWIPATASYAGISVPPSCRLGAPVQYQGNQATVVSFSDATGNTASLLLDKDNRAVRVETLASHPRLGDVCNWTRFDQWESRDGVAVPTEAERFIVMGSLTVRYRLALKEVHFEPLADERFELPESHRRDLPDWRSTPSAPAAATTMVQLAPKVWSVEIASANARALAVERESDLVVLEAPDGDGACADLLQALHTQFPSKPVAAVAFGHHHPSPSGGLRAFAAAGATIVAPRPLEDYVRTLLNRPTSLGPPAIGAPTDAKVELFDGEHTIEAGDSSVQLIDIGKASAHADTYVVFYIAPEGILFEGDLSYFSTKGPIRVNPRLTGLVEAIEKRGITPRRLVQTWPVSNALREVPWSSVTSVVAADREREQRARDKEPGRP